MKALQRTAAFVRAVSVDIWRREGEEREEEEEFYNAVETVVNGYIARIPC